MKNELKLFGLENEQIIKGSVPESCDFSEFTEKFQKRHHVLAIVKCLERSSQPQLWKDYETDKWYIRQTQTVIPDIVMPSSGDNNVRGLVERIHSINRHVNDMQARVDATIRRREQVQHMLNSIDELDGRIQSLENMNELFLRPMVAVSNEAKCL